MKMSKNFLLFIVGNLVKKKVRVGRSKARRKRRMDKYIEKIKLERASGIHERFSLSNSIDSSRIWLDPNSPTGYSQVCSWQGICKSPFNGDC